MMARSAVLLLVLTVALLARTVLMPAVAVAGIAPDPVLLVVAAVALAGGPATGARCGFAAGLAVDLLADSGLPLGSWALALALAGHVTGTLRLHLSGEALSGPVLAAVVAAVVGLGSAGLLAMLLDAGGVTAAGTLRAALGTALYHVPFAPLVVPPVAALSRRYGVAAVAPG